MEQQKIAKIKQELKANYKFIKYDGLILETFATNLLKLHSSDVSKTIEYLEILSKKDITDKFISIVKDFETSNEISEVIKSSIQIENEKVKVRQAKVNVLDKETDDLLEYKEELEADLAKLKTEQEKITDDFKQICQARETIFTDKIKQLEITKTTLQDTIDGVYRNELYEDEFNIPECKYILKEPVIHLNVDKIIDDLKENNCEISNINANIITFESQNQFIGDHRKCQHCFGHCGHNAFTQDKLKINLNFPIDFKLNNDEFIVKIYVLNGNIFNNNIFNNVDTPYKIPIIYSIIYITNFGRFIKSDDLILIPSIYNYCIDRGMGGNYNYKFEYIKILNTHIIYENNKANISTNGNRTCAPTYCPNQGNSIGCQCNIANILMMQIGGQSNKIILNELPSLTYRIPKLFLDVIDAFQQQNNDLMQQCCKRYLDITRETDRKKEILTTLQFNKTIKEKDNIIARKENIIKEHSVIIDYQNEELEKLKNENAKLKKALQSFLNE